MMFKFNGYFFPIVQIRCCVLVSEYQISRDIVAPTKVDRSKTATSDSLHQTILFADAKVLKILSTIYIIRKARFLPDSA